MSAHLGTHADAPCHVLAGAATIGQMPLFPYLGPARVVVLSGRGELGPEELPAKSLQVSRVLFRSRGHAFLSPMAALRLAEGGALLVGTDSRSIDPPDAEDLPAHTARSSRGGSPCSNISPSKPSKRGSTSSSRCLSGWTTSTRRPSGRC